MLVNTKAKVGVFSIALGAYLPQFRHWYLSLKHSMKPSKKQFRIQ